MAVTASQFLRGVPQQCGFATRPGSDADPHQKLNRIPTFTLRESLPMQVYVTSDLWVLDVDHHTMGSS
jgi:hypothetical protein